jgi:hypothetical protein
MKKSRGGSAVTVFEAAAGLLCLLAQAANAATLYVDLNSTNATPPYTNWLTAATNIQDAIDAATNGDTVLVNDGVYTTGGRPVNGYALTNRVAVTKPLTVQSVNGPAVTIIQGYQMPSTIRGDSAVRCVYLTNNAVLNGFTLTNGASRAAGDLTNEQFGAGVWCESTAAIVSNCVVCGNSAASGGGAYQALLNNCTLTGNSATSGGWVGGGACNSTLNNCTLIRNSATLGSGACNSTLNNCALRDNWGALDGGGVSGGTLNGCTLTGNSAVWGGGAYNATLNNCTLTANSASWGGGASYATLNNCIVYYNSGGNYDSATLNYCCTDPLPTNGTGNISSEPQLASVSHLGSGSPCIGAGSGAYTTGTDIDGEAWAAPPSIGCDEYHPESATGPLTVAIRCYDTLSTGLSTIFTNDISGRVTDSRWEFDDGTILSNRPYVSHSWTVPGDYPVVLRAFNQTYPDGVTATVTVHVVQTVVHYVSLVSTNPVGPYTSWATAATNIQDAVDAVYAAPQAMVMVSNGVYSTGGRGVLISPYQTALLNRVAVTKPVTVQSANGPAVTVIQGYQVPGTTNGDSAVRCVYLASNAVLTGFTLTNGATRKTGGLVSPQDWRGGGVWSESSSATVSNCVLSANSASDSGGGAYQSTLNNCTLTGNSASTGGGAYGGTLNNCTLTTNSASSGGGAYTSTLNNCTLTSNSASSGGGTYSSTLNNCTLTGNSATIGGGAFIGTLNSCTLSNNSASLWGGGAFGQSPGITLNNCTLTGNSSSQAGGGALQATLINCTLTSNSASYSGGGASGGALTNCIVYFNTAASGPNYNGSFLKYCCTTPLPAGTGNFTNAPLFVNQAGGNLRLQSNSPCINSGNNAYAPAGPDLDGNPRISGGTVDVGAYEFQNPASVISYVWLQRYGLPTDGTADYADSDNDGLNNWQEWIAGTNPTNASSVLKMSNPTNAVSSVMLKWQSVSGVNYFLQRATDLGAPPAFSTIQSNIVGQAGTTTYTDTNAVGAGPFFYRVGVQQ